MTRAIFYSLYSLGRERVGRGGEVGREEGGREEGGSGGRRREGGGGCVEEKHAPAKVINYRYIHPTMYVPCLIVL